MTSKPLHVRLEVMVDGEHPERCGDCPFLEGDTGGLWCALFFERLDHHVISNRCADCVEATTADALNAAVVEAAQRWSASGPSLSFNHDRELWDAVDALRTAERKAPT